MSQLDMRRTIRFGLIAGVVAVSVSAIGMVVTFDERDIITGVLTLGQLLLYGIPLLAGYMVVRGDGEVKAGTALLHGLVAGLFVALPLVALILLTIIWPAIRTALPNVSPALIEILTFGQGEIVGSIVLTLVMMVMGALGAGFHILPERIQKPLVSGIAWTLGIGLFSEILINIFRPVPRSIIRIVFGTKGITPLLAVIIFVVATIFSAWWEAGGRKRFRDRKAALTTEQESRLGRVGKIALVILIVTLPWVLGIYLSEVLDVVGIFVLMGLGT